MDGTPGQPTPIDAALLMMRLLYAALLASVAVYVVVANVIPFSEGPPPDEAMTLGLAVAGAAFGNGLGAPKADDETKASSTPVRVRVRGRF